MDPTTSCQHLKPYNARRGAYSMDDRPAFASLGQKAGSIDVRLSRKIVKLFSEGLYTSPNKAIEELVANSFDAGARSVHVLASPGAGMKGTIAVIDDGEGMDGKGLKKHWFIGRTDKRRLERPPLGREQIGKFGIGKLATYVLANRLTHVSKCGNEYYSASMDYSAINNHTNGEVGSDSPVTIPLFRMTEAQARDAVSEWANTPAFKKSKMPLFGKDSRESWTVSVMSDLKPLSDGIKDGRLAWILRTALPLQADFAVWLNGERMRPSKEDRDPIKRWVIGKDIGGLPRPAPDASASTDARLPPSNEHRFGLDVEGLGRVTGHAEMYESALTGKSDDWGRSSGFFVYARGRLLNEADGHFGIQPNELRHGTFSRFRAVVHIDKLDEALRSSREAVGDSEAASAARNVLRGIFNTVRKAMDEHDRGSTPDEKLSTRVSAGPASLSRRPIAALARAAAEGKAMSHHLAIPDGGHDRREDVLARLDHSVMRPEAFITGREMDDDGDPEDVIAKFDCVSRRLRINARHPFVVEFDYEFTSKKHSLPLELLVMSDVAAEARMYQDGLDPGMIEEMVMARDRHLRSLAYESGRQSPPHVASALERAQTPKEFEKCVCDAFRSLGFDVRPIGDKGKPDGIATARLAADEKGAARRYAVSIEAKSKTDGGSGGGRAVSANAVDVSAVASHCREHGCDHAVVVGPAFQGDGEKSSLSKFIDAATTGGGGGGPSTITLIRTGDLARLVRLRPVKLVGLADMRGLFRECKMPAESAAWIGRIAKRDVRRPPYRRIIGAIAEYQRDVPATPVKYEALLVWLMKMDPPVKFDKAKEVAELCRTMAQMSGGAIRSYGDRVELDQSEENAADAIETALQECERKSLGGGGRGGGTGGDGGRDGVGA